MGLYLYACPDKTEMLDKISWNQDIFNIIDKYFEGQCMVSLSVESINSMIEELVKLGDCSMPLVKKLNDLMLQNLNDEYFIFNVA